MSSIGPIKEFKGQYAFLSNFYPSIVEWNGIVFPTVEHAYQSAKCINRTDAFKIQRAITPGIAKRIGRSITPIWPFWGDRKLDVMVHLLRQKFAHPELRKKLLDTEPRQLIEGNDWHDLYWGVYDGKGENWLGKLLMFVRQEIGVINQ